MQELPNSLQRARVLHPQNPNSIAWPSSSSQLPGSCYEKISDTQRHNLFSVGCTEEGIYISRKNRRGFRCNKCQDEWTKKSSRYKHKVKNWGIKLRDVERCLNAPLLSDADGLFMKDFCKNDPANFKADSNLKELVRERYEYYKTAKVRQIIKNG